jgi:hypothetical protein
MVSQFLQGLSTSVAPGLIVILVLVVLASGFKTGWIGQFITALNSLNTPWVAIIVVILGMIYNLKCKAFGLPSDSANQVIGGGLGLLTGQALNNRAGTHSTSTVDTVVPPIASVVEPPKEGV